MTLPTSRKYNINRELAGSFFIVLATANNDFVGQFNLTNGYRTYELFDEIEFELNDKKYTGIVLDACGSCFGVAGEQYQRFDIFTIGSLFGKAEGYIYV